LEQQQAQATYPAELLRKRRGFLMNFFDAKKLLDEVKEGIPHPLHKITLALQLTGDLDFE
jgi:hypothetical protein